MKTIKFLLLMLLCAYTCMACKSNESLYSSCQNCEFNGDTTYLTSKMNEACTVINGNDTMIFSFVDVTDGRCQKSICPQCYGSKADISLSITNAKNTKVNINLSIIGCIDELSGNPNTYPWGEGIDTLGYRFQLVKLSPYPDITTINKNDYTAKIKIIKL